MQQKSRNLLTSLCEDVFMSRAVMLILFGCMFCTTNFLPWIHDYNIGIAAVARKFWLSLALFILFAVSIILIERKKKLFLSIGICVLLLILVAIAVYSLQWRPFLYWTPPAITAAIDVTMIALLLALHPAP